MKKIINVYHFVAIVFVLILINEAKAQQTIVRKPLLTASPINRMVTRTEIKEINFGPSQKSGLHLHPCPVTGYIANGTVMFQVKGGPLQTLKAGSAFFEPADTEIVHFDNASATDSCKFIAFYLINNEKELIKMLPQK